MANQKYEAFLKVAETGSFKQAALELGYTQAGVSYLVSALERELDLPLFVRDYGGARLTADGAELLPWVRSVRADERRLETRVAELKHLASGVVRVGAFTSTAIQWFSFNDRYSTFTQGMFSISSVIFFISVVAVFVFLTARKVESRRWS